jgi:hypothetical protein
MFGLPNFVFLRHSGQLKVTVPYPQASDQMILVESYDDVTPGYIFSHERCPKGELQKLIKR